MEILYISIGSFWKNAAMKTFQHHDALFNALRKIIPDLRIHLGIPMQGRQYYKDLIENHNDKRVIDSWKTINYVPHADLYKGDYDAMIINGSEDFWDIDAPDRTIPADEVNQYIYDCAYQCTITSKPVILFDPDNYVNENIGGDLNKNLARRLHNLLKGYDKYYLTGPFSRGIPTDSVNPYVFTPFTLDPDECSSEIKPLSEREYFMKYVGNNYHRDNFIPYFLNCTKFGKCQVVGSGWTGVQNGTYPGFDPKEIEWKLKFPLTSDKVVDYYSDSKIALYGTTTIPSFKEYGHYPMRLREFYQAGVLVVPEADHVSREWLDSLGFCNTDSLAYSSDFSAITDTIRTDSDYEEYVRNQRDRIKLFLDANRYAKKWKYMLCKEI